ncbi:prepilin-type N-terminal cleavage/methylation domain-containing protein [Victivallis vadensis]|uniref:Prepilin-type N-terminal cleavage/methylation domain-containing protein n=1 Tax=Victivallis vadensis TaxID=172901 RepID=A0A848B286_9BACT|nr:prepilin-type N-terminal cleavage/methylation domain-containing protein [Victivallis vadensis]
MRKFFCFTLMEMLIVIFIISIGAAILCYCPKFCETHL